VRFLIAGMSPEFFKNYKHTKEKVKSRERSKKETRSVFEGCLLCMVVFSIGKNLYN
jgi:hypothetical protein